MKQHKQIALGIATTCLLFACKKDDHNNSSTPTNNLTAMEKLLIGSWSLQSGVDSFYTNNGINEVKDALEPCQKDDVYTFKDDNSYTVKDGANKCSPSTDFNSFVSWSISKDTLLKNFHSLSIYLDESPSIIQLDNTTFKLSYQKSTSLPGGYWSYQTHIFTFKRK